MKNQLVSIALTTVVAVSLTCGAVFAERSAIAQEAASQPDPMQFARGARAWSNSCARCHNMREPQELRDDQWRTVISHMRVRAGLSGGEARDVLAFLQVSN